MYPHSQSSGCSGIPHRYEVRIRIAVLRTERPPYHIRDFQIGPSLFDLIRSVDIHRNLKSLLYSHPVHEFLPSFFLLDQEEISDLTEVDVGFEFFLKIHENPDGLLGETNVRRYRKLLPDSSQRQPCGGLS